LVRFEDRLRVWVASLGVVMAFVSLVKETGVIRFE